MKPFSVVVLISGQGSNLQAIIDANKNNPQIVLSAVISNNANAYGLQRAHQAKIPSHVIDHQLFSNRSDFESALREKIDQYNPDLVVLAGFMRKLQPDFVSHYAGKMINIHPSLLPRHRGLNTHQRVLQAREKEHGISIHFVTEEVDGGPLILQAKIMVKNDDEVQTLMQRTQKLEHRYYPEVISWIAEGRLVLVDHRVQLDGKILPKPGKILNPQINDSY